MSVKRAERLIHLANILRSGQGYTAPELAKLMGVSARTVYRDVVDLSSIVPVYCDNGYRLLPESYIANLSFTRDELLVIKLGMQMPVLANASHLAAAALSALSKIEDQLAIRYGANDDVVSVSFDVDAYPLTERMMRTLRLLEEAVREQRVVTLKYHASHDDRWTSRVVNPYGLTFRRRSWYLVGFCRLRNSERVFRLDRMRDVIATKQRFEKPANFSIASFFQDSWEVYGPGEKAKVKLRFSSYLEDTVKPQLDRRGTFQKDTPHKALIFEGEVPLSEEFVRWLLTFGGDVEVITPAPLRSLIAQKAQAITALYPTAKNTSAPKLKRRH